MLTFIIVYLTIGLVLELIVDGKKMIKDIKNKRFSILTAILGTIIMSVMAPILFVYGMIRGATHQHTNKES